jgi:2-C-methyl-D-erythritol 4-phosphate cytidylyltransferase
MIEWSLEAFRASASVGAIVVAVPPDRVGAVGEELDLVAGEDLDMVAGGATRAQSVANALAAVETAYVAIHDAARPLLTPELVEALVADLDGNPEAAGVIAAAPVTDTIKRGSFRTHSDRKEPRDEGGGEGHRSRGSFRTSGDRKEPQVVVATEDRTQLWAAQTPQLFRTAALRAALAAAARPEEATDEAMLIEQAGGTVVLHPVEGQNLKVTTPLDLRVAELLLQSRSST